MSPAARINSSVNASKPQLRKELSQSQAVKLRQFCPDAFKIHDAILEEWKAAFDPDGEASEPEEKRTVLGVGVIDSVQAGQSPEPTPEEDKQVLDEILDETNTPINGDESDDATPTESGEPADAAAGGAEADAGQVSDVSGAGEDKD